MAVVNPPGAEVGEKTAKAPKAPKAEKVPKASKDPNAPKAPRAARQDYGYLPGATIAMDDTDRSEKYHGKRKT